MCTIALVESIDIAADDRRVYTTYRQCFCSCFITSRHVEPRSTFYSYQHQCTAHLYASSLDYRRRPIVVANTVTLQAKYTSDSDERAVIYKRGGCIWPGRSGRTAGLGGRLNKQSRLVAVPTAARHGAKCVA